MRRKTLEFVVVCNKKVRDPPLTVFAYKIKCSLQVKSEALDSYALA
jgi:hypothetical protein